MTERLYYTDAYLRTFEASVVRAGVRAGRTSIVLDRTAFYPTSGGQPFDTGALALDPNGQRLNVVDVVDDDNGDIEHVVDASPDALRAGQVVQGSIDWDRRFDHMQQHTGQHVLSAAIDRLFGVRTVSFHLGAESSTIDLSRELTRDELVSSEIAANDVVWEDRPVAVRFVSADEASRLPLRKESIREGVLRLIDVDRFDLSACGGTHVGRAGGIGIIAIGSAERFKGGQRVEFLCGGRALRRFRSMRDTLAGAVRALSVLPDAVPAALEKLQSELRERQRALLVLQDEVAGHRAEELAASARPAAGANVVATIVDGNANELKSLASKIVSRPGRVALLVSATTPTLVVAARSEDVAFEANTLIAALIARFGGRGGGKPALAQAGGLDADPSAILSSAILTLG
jgi:alanyl-tRNA synthetase